MASIESATQTQPDTTTNEGPHPSSQVDFTSCLPPELLLHIFQMVLVGSRSKEELVQNYNALTQVSRRFYIIANDHQMHEIIFRRLLRTYPIEKFRHFINTRPCGLPPVLHLGLQRYHLHRPFSSDIAGQLSRVRQKTPYEHSATSTLNLSNVSFPKRPIRNNFATQDAYVESVIDLLKRYFYPLRDLLSELPSLNTAKLPRRGAGGYERALVDVIARKAPQITKWDLSLIQTPRTLEIYLQSLTDNPDVVVTSISFQGCQFAPSLHVLQAFLIAHPEITTMNFNGCPWFSGEHLTLIGDHSENIGHLECEECPLIVDRDFFLLIARVDLLFLDVSGCRFNLDDAFGNQGKSAALQTLLADRCHTFKGSPRFFASLRRLRFLSVVDCRGLAPDFYEIKRRFELRNVVRIRGPRLK